MTPFKYPSFVQLSITNKCNLACKHCFNDSGNASSNELKEEEIYELLDYFLAKSIVCFTFGGGEPLVHPKIFEFIKYASTRGGRITLLSNGVLIDKKTAWKLYESGVFRVRISIDGSNKEINDFIRSKGSFKGAVNALRNLRETPIEDVAVMTNVNKHNFSDLENIVKLAIEMGVDDIKFIPTILEGRAKREFSSYVLEDNFYKTLLKKKNQIEKKYKDCIEINVDSPLEAITFKNDKERLEECGPCVMGRTFLGIGESGDIFICPMLEDVIIGNVREDDIGFLWRNSPILKKIRNQNLLKGKCQKCKIKKYCGGGCRGIAYLQSGDVLNPDPYCWL